MITEAPIASPVCVAAQAVLEAIDGLAEALTGNRCLSHGKPHMPGLPSTCIAGMFGPRPSAARFLLVSVTAGQRQTMSVSRFSGWGHTASQDRPGRPGAGRGSSVAARRTDGRWGVCGAGHGVVAFCPANRRSSSIIWLLSARCCSGFGGQR